MAFTIGDLVVYPSHGVGMIDAIDARIIDGEKKSFYRMRILEKGMTILIPTENEQVVGLRGIIPLKEVSEIYGILKEKNTFIEYNNWNRRYRKYSEKLRTGSLYEIASVMRDLFLLKAEKTLSFGEQRMLRQARDFLVKELSIAQGSPEDLIEEDIRAILNSNSTH